MTESTDTPPVQSWLRSDGQTFGALVDEMAVVGVTWTGPDDAGVFIGSGDGNDWTITPA